MPKAFNQFDRDKTIKNDCEKRTYYTRQFVNTKSMTDTDGHTDAEDLEVRDYKFSATSYPEAMGLMIGDMVQNYAYNMSVKVLMLFEDWFKTSGQILDDEKALDNLDEFGIKPDEEEIARLKDRIKNEWQDVMIPAGFAVKILEGIVDNIRTAPNLLHWQEPELIIMGNPNLVENMHVKAETLSDVAEDGIKDMEKFLINFSSKKQEEE